MTNAVQDNILNVNVAANMIKYYQLLGPIKHSVVTENGKLKTSLILGFLIRLTRNWIMVIIWKMFNVKM